MKVEIRKIGNSCGVILPKQILDKLNVKEGDSLTLAENESGITLSPYDPDFDVFKEAYDKNSTKYRNALRELAK